ncbi:MAG TPA: hypothetical protein VGA37_00055 [Gemmatimonadales bacterium]
MDQHTITVRRTARYLTLGPTDGTAREIWFACHGYGQLARRFVRMLAPLDDGARLVVVPEGLSRFYTDHTTGTVGASWMTTEDRLREIEDYVALLDAIHEAVGAGSAGVPIHLLGFSQGSATAWRWIAMGAVRPVRLVLWGGEIPKDMDWSRHGDRFRSVHVLMVAGDRDEFTPPSAMTQYQRILAQHGISHRMEQYRGAHDVDKRVFARLLREED